MSLEFGNLLCCGVKELRGIGHFETSADIIRALGEFTYFKKIKDRLNPRTGEFTYKQEPFDRFRFIVFSQAGQYDDYGFRLAAFIHDNKLGSLVETDFHLNPNSGNKLKVWIWTVDHNTTRQWLEKDRKANDQTVAVSRVVE